LTSVTCTKVGTNGISVKLTFSGGSNIASSPITFLINNVQNPPDTRVTDAFNSVMIKDSTGLVLTQYSGTSVTV
jgi:hypothetical protein